MPCPSDQYSAQNERSLPYLSRCCPACSVTLYAIQMCPFRKTFTELCLNHPIVLARRNTPRRKAVPRNGTKLSWGPGKWRRRRHWKAFIRCFLTVCYTIWNSNIQFFFCCFFIILLLFNRSFKLCKRNRKDWTLSKLCCCFSHTLYICGNVAHYVPGCVRWDRGSSASRCSRRSTRSGESHYGTLRWRGSRMKATSTYSKSSLCGTIYGESGTSNQMIALVMLALFAMRQLPLLNWPEMKAREVLIASTANCLLLVLRKQKQKRNRQTTDAGYIGHPAIASVG